MTMVYVVVIGLALVFCGTRLKSKSNWEKAFEEGAKAGMQRGFDIGFERGVTAMRDQLIEEVAKHNVIEEVA